MKKLVVVVLVVAVAWGYYSKRVAINPTHVSSNSDVTKSTTKKKQNNYQCDGRQHCSQMSSYEEAKYFLENCPDTKMDGDNDGIPCERQFNR